MLITIEKTYQYSKFNGLKENVKRGIDNYKVKRQLSRDLVS